ncbi:formyltetrahydrofolate deformylase [Kushneria phosphatilytica]|uniref:Formyltetrahydrofolate deformylase n=1 Tax=Kushneria phosphatilytica TaxID=657387 RepID=A0A1S1NWV6_9GAMM|nr:formyltetrahydrofolate deformylase [Kushneria phosphatilytica]OHV12062.1 formyltetrahydrofolate deformylase [Kushneria phosphatilytica]QEL11254.1 formyltetrahydrofolate deformylase [Kushneria phosphatilytica]
MSYDYRLVVACPDQVGIVARVSTFIAAHSGSIIEASQHSDLTSQRFFMRYEVRFEQPRSQAQLNEAFQPIAESFDMEWRWQETAQKRRVAIMVSRQSHCLVDLLYRWSTDELNCEIACVIANHEDLRSLVEWHGLEYHCVPVTSEGREAAFMHIDQLIESHNVDTIILARYMQILPPWFCARYQGQVINIHHSFLPSFAGARPYHQAFERGVKLIGATCHYVTDELDAGPIIEQDIQRVTHCHTADDLVRLGRDVEKSVLARGVRWHLQDRILIQGNKTVVFA